MYARLMLLWRGGTQLVLGSIATWLVLRGINVDPDLRNAVEAALFALGPVIYMFVAHWLETRTGDGLFAKACRALARIMMVGAPPVLSYKKEKPEPAMHTRASYR